MGVTFLMSSSGGSAYTNTLYLLKMSRRHEEDMGR